MRGRIRVDLRFAVAGALALVAALLVMAVTRSPARVAVLVAGEPLPPGTLLDELPVEERLVELLPGMIVAERRSELQGRSLAVAVEAGSPILWSQLGTGDGDPGYVVALALDEHVPPDMRPGDLVDVYLSNDQGTRRIAESVVVVDASSPGGGFAGGEMTILLSVDAPLAERVIAATHAGSLDLVRRER